MAWGRESGEPGGARLSQAEALQLWSLGHLHPLRLPPAWHLGWSPECHSQFLAWPTLSTSAGGSRWAQSGEKRPPGPETLPHAHWRKGRSPGSSWPSVPASATETLSPPPLPQRGPGGGRLGAVKPGQIPAALAAVMLVEWAVPAAPEAARGPPSRKGGAGGEG